jgi:hypothetical protein
MYTQEEIEFLREERTNPNITGCVVCEYGYSQCTCDDDYDGDMFSGCTCTEQDICNFCAYPPFDGIPEAD